MKFKLLILSLIITGTASAQFFGSVPKPKNVATLKLRQGVALTAAQAEEVATVKNEFRPIVNILSTAIQINKSETNTGVVALTGAGVSYQHLIWNPTTEKWNAQWSINALAWYSRVISGDEMKPFMYGATLGLFDNKAMGGIATDGKNWAVTVGFGIPLNNL